METGRLRLYPNDTIPLPYFIILPSLFALRRLSGEAERRYHFRR